MDITSLKAVLADLRKKIIPSRFEKVQQVDANTLQIGFRSLTGFIWIETSWHADSARIVETTRPFKAIGTSTLAKQIQHGLKGMALVELNQHGFERVVEFHFALRPNEKFKRLLVIELMGRHSNLIFLDQEKKVISLGKQIRENKSRLRPISTGDIYLSPPSLKGTKPTKNESFKSWKEKLCILPVNLGKALQQNFQGISPSLAMQLASDNKLSAEKLIDTQVEELSDKDWNNLYIRWTKWLQAIGDERFSICFNGPTPYRVWKSIHLQSDIKKDISRIIGEYYEESLSLIKLEQIEREIKKKLLSIKLSEEDLLKKKQLLLANNSELELIKGKADSILCQSNPTKEKIKEAQRLYQKAKKIRRSESILKTRVSYHKQRFDFILETELFLDEIIHNKYENTLSKISAINQLKENFENYLNLKSNKKKKRNFQNKDYTNILETITPNGLVIQIGRNHIQNEFISIKKARKGDIWFHAQECPGSHVVMKGSHGISEELDMQIAADLAAFFSRAKNNQKVPIIMVPTTKLNKLKGASPGTVNYREGKVIWGNPSKGKSHMEKSTAITENAL